MVENIKIVLDLYSHSGYRYRPFDCIFNLNGEFILYSEVDDQLNFDSTDNKILWVYSTQTENNKWKCKRIYKIPEDFELISISKYDKLNLFSNNYFYEWNILTEKCIRIFANKD